MYPSAMPNPTERCIKTSALALLLSIGGCYGPFGPGLDQGEADLAADGQYDERAQDGTLGETATASLTADGAVKTNGLGDDPFLLGQQQAAGGTPETSVYPPGAQAILVPRVDSTTGDIPSDPESELPPG